MQDASLRRKATTYTYTLMPRNQLSQMQCRVTASIDRHICSLAHQDVQRLVLNEKAKDGQQLAAKWFT